MFYFILIVLFVFLDDMQLKWTWSRLAISLLVLGFLLSNELQAQRKKKKDKGKPEWVTSRPVDQAYFQGIGVAAVNTYTQGHVEEAKRKALQDIISEISVNIKSTSMMQQVERNNELNSMYQALTSVKAENSIEGYELVGSWADETHYWVYYRLSKELYYRNKQRRLDRAKGVASQYYESGMQSLESGNAGRAYEDFVKGLVALKEYLDEEIMIVTDNGKEYLVDALTYALIDLNRNIKINSPTKSLKVRLAREVEEEIRVNASFKGSGMAVSLRPYFTTGSGEVPASVMSNEAGDASFYIQRVTGGESMQVMEVSVDVEGMTAEDRGSDLMAQLIRLKCGVPSHKINIEADKIKAHLVVEAEKFGMTDRQSNFSKAIVKLMSDQGYAYTDTKEGAEVEITASIKSRKGESHELRSKVLYTAYVDLYIGIVNVRSGTQVFYKGFGDIKGSRSGSFELALQEAESLALDKFVKELMPEISNIDLE